MPSAGTRRTSSKPRKAKAAAPAEVWKRLKQHWPNPRCELRHANPLELLVAVILSAQCTDARVNKVTEALFQRYRTARDYAESPEGELEAFIRPTGFYRNKAKNIRGACRLLADKHGGRVPDTMDELLRLPGVARKTANVVLSTAFGRAEGIVVDTHMARVARRLGLTKETNPVKIERDLMRLFPRKDWGDLSHAVVLHGRYVCKARRPLCGECRLNTLCPSREA